MRCMIIVKATKDADMPSAELLQDMGKFNQTSLTLAFSLPPTVSRQVRRGPSDIEIRQVFEAEDFT